MSKVKWAFIYHSPGAAPDNKRLIVEGDGMTSVLVAVENNAEALSAAAILADEGIQFIELCGSFQKTPDFVQHAQEATRNRVPIGAVRFDERSAREVAALFNLEKG